MVQDHAPLIRPSCAIIHLMDAPVRDLVLTIGLLGGLPSAIIHLMDPVVLDLFLTLRHHLAIVHPMDTRGADP